ncbi:LamG-like jellyroll fold domain-containing protein [Tamlana sp. I1]|uniref:LamG-like jellyroll fold domain-containing protein n=1 Tax=Tamlana sp. I1 TaxID=2762061 RepID=UPI00188E9D55|nr:LamG-like jellyroll fold domain-containing protein [Tamlana sp. I1]
MIKTYVFYFKSILIALFFLVNQFSLNAQCTPSNVGTNSQVGITNVTITGESASTINNTSVIGQGWTNYTAKSVNVKVGGICTFSITNTNGSWGDGVKTVLWIDYGDGNFIEAYNSEEFKLNLKSSGTIQITKQLQDTAVLRVVSFYCRTCDPQYDVDACNFEGKITEVEDYTLNFALPSTPEAFDDELIVGKDSSGVSNQINVGANDMISNHLGDGDDFSIATTPSQGSITEQDIDGTFEYVPNPGYVGTDSFTYSICDSNGNCDTATVNIIINTGACEPVSHTNGNAYITNVKLDGANSTSINNNSGDDGGYGNYLNTPSVDLIAGSEKKVYISVAGGPLNLGLFIDYNKDGIFSDSEFIRGTNNNYITFTIPNNASVGTTVMRIGAEKNWFQQNPCGITYDLQEFEDYFVNISSKLEIRGNNNLITNGATITNSINNTYFGTVELGSASITKTFTIINTNPNTGNIKLPANPVSFIASSSDFTISQQPTKKTVLNNGNPSTTFEVTFTPSSSGFKQATISVASDDPNNNPYTFIIEAEVTAPAVIINGSHALSFDGVDDYVETPNFLDGLSEITLMCWIKPESDGSTQQFVIGQDNFNIIINGTNIRTIVNETSIGSSTTALQQGVWIHVAVTYNTATGLANMYINGEDHINGSKNVGTTLKTSANNFTIGKNPAGNDLYFIGEIDEVRVFSEALTELDIQKMMNQELDDTNFNKGKIIDREIKSSLNGSLLRYYTMDNYIGDAVVDKTGNTDATMYNDGISNIRPQTAPLPFVTTTDGDWNNSSTWLHGDAWDIHDYTLAKDWSIVNINHDVKTSTYHSNLGLFISENGKLEVNNHVELKNTWYLKLEGELDLQGESQLVQTQDSQLEAGPYGILQRDQQGTVNMYSYNLWSSPVHSFNTNGLIDGNETYTVADILYDGQETNNPQPITFVGGYDGDDTSDPIKIADYWIYKYTNKPRDTYALWQQIKSTGELKVGEGYTMKGPGKGDISNDHNYVYIGTPNNGEITLETHEGNEYLVGNPYPSVIDAAEFLNDNPHLDGTLYFWEHFGGGSHYLADYEGGYGLYNHSGGTPALSGKGAKSHPDVSQTGKSSKTPQRYIAVGQGFFVNAESDGETKFENDQRVFVDEASKNSIFLKSASNKTSAKTEATKYDDVRPKLRIHYESPKGYVRELLTTVDENATLGHDWGYDGRLNETNIEDMYWNIENDDYIIQGIDAITEETVLPLTVKTKKGGLIEISINTLENVPDDVQVYLKDHDTYFDLRNSSYFTNVEAGLTSNRFEIAFSDKTKTLDINSEDHKLGVQLFYNALDSNIIINNPKSQTVETLQAVNMLGQIVFEKHINASDKKIVIPTHLSSGMYVFSVKTSDTEISKKVAVSN